MIKHLHPSPAVSGLALAALALFTPLSGGARAQTPVQSAAIRVDLNAEKAPVSPTLYGSLMEEISHGVDGGISERTV